MAENVTSEQLQSIVTENDTETSIGEALSEALDASGATFEDDPTPAMEPETEELEDEETPGDPDAESVDAPKKESVSEDAAAAKSPDESDQEKTDQVEDPDAKGATGSLTPPGTWSAEEKAEFIDLPEKAQAAILRREGDRDRAFSQKQTEMNQTVQRYADMDRVLEPHKEGLALRGMTPATLLGQYLATSQALANNPIETFKYLADQYGVDLSTINQAAPEETPEYADMRTRLDRQDAIISQFQNSQDQQTASQQTRQRAELADSLTAFADSTDEAGNPKYPHFEELRKDMSAIVYAAGQQGQKMDLDEAYQRALWASPGHRESILAQEARKREKAAEKGRKEHADKAKKAGSSVAGAPSGGSTPDPSETLAQTINRNWDKTA